MSQEGLGKAIGQDQQYISKLERGAVTGITMATLERLADALGVSMDYLAGRTTKKEMNVFEPAEADLVPA
jgi:transcriptional regulator with XRE-family HTH domain